MSAAGRAHFPNTQHVIEVERSAARGPCTLRSESSGTRAMNFSEFFIERPIFAGVLSMVIFLAGLLSLPALPISEYPEVVPPTVVVTRELSRRQSEDHRRDGRHAARRADQRRRELAVHELPGDHRRRDDAHRHVQDRHRPRQGAAAGAEPRFAGPAAPARGGARRWA